MYVQANSYAERRGAELKHHVGQRLGLPFSLPRSVAQSAIQMNKCQCVNPKWLCSGGRRWRGNARTRMSEAREAPALRGQPGMALAAAAAFTSLGLRGAFGSRGCAGCVTRREILAVVWEYIGTCDGSHGGGAGEPRRMRGGGITDAADATDSALTTEVDRESTGASA